MSEWDEQWHEEEDERPLPAEETYKRRGLARIAEIRKRLQEGAA
jgi:hypothetical protein